MKNTKIEWATHTFNPWEGCQKISPGCDNCYAEARNARFGGGVAINWGPNAPRRRTSRAYWEQPLRWNKQAQAMQAGWQAGIDLHGGDEAACIAAGYIKPERPRVFCASLADVFDNAVPPEWRADLLNLIAATPNLDWLLLTKRIGNAAEMLEQAMLSITNEFCGWQMGNGYMRCPNIWLGATVVNQAEADRDIPKLLATPVAKRFLSIEPMLGTIDLLGRNLPLRKIDWVICGGESGQHARPMHPDWARSLRDQCVSAGVPFLFKQWGEWHTNYIKTSDEPVFRQFANFQNWVNKASTWVNGGICLDVDGKQLRNGRDMMQARDQSKFPVTIMHRVGKKAAGRLLDGREWNEVAK